jgi:hypothetical protein
MSNFVKEGMSLDYCFGNRILFKLRNFGQKYILIASEVTCFDFFHMKNISKVFLIILPFFAN